MPKNMKDHFLPERDPDAQRRDRARRKVVAIKKAALAARREAALQPLEEVDLLQDDPVDESEMASEVVLESDFENEYEEDGFDEFEELDEQAQEPVLTTPAQEQFEDDFEDEFDEAEEFESDYLGGSDQGPIRHAHDDVIVLRKRNSKKARALHALRTRCELAGDVSMLTVAGVNRRSGASFVAANLASSFALAGKQTLIVDVNLSNPRQHTLFGLGVHARGLTDALSEDDASSMKLKIHQAGDNLNVLTVGTDVYSGEDKLLGHAIERLFKAVSSRFDMVVFDAPAIEKSAVADWFAHLSGHSLMVVKQHATRLEDVREAQQRLAQHSNLVGVALNKVPLISGVFSGLSALRPRGTPNF